MTGTAVTFPVDPTNLDYLMPDTRLQLGDLTGSLFSDQIVRFGLISAIRYLQRIWNGKYQLYIDKDILNPQPSGVPSGYTRINSLHGVADIPNTYTFYSVFRDPYIQFISNAAMIIEPIDEQAIILAAVYLLRKVQITSNVTDFVSWSTEDIKYSNLGSQRGLSQLLESDLLALNTYIASKLGKPRISKFSPQYIPQIIPQTFTWDGVTAI